MRQYCLVILIIFISGCAPRILMSGPKGVSIDPVSFPVNMEKIQEMADAECAKYNRIATEKISRSSSKSQPLGWAMSQEMGQKNYNPNYTNISINFSCDDRPVESVPSYEWPQLPQIVP